MFGLLNVNKPKGLTSRDAVNRVHWLVRQIESAAAGKRLAKKAVSKVGHAGTLDPIATGVLVVCVGPATRLIEHVQAMTKRYRGTFLLGQRSPSDDVELPPEQLTGVPVPTLDEIQAALPRFTGPIEQVPPPYSAVKIKGEKAYDRVRRGESVDMKPREVTIHALDIVCYDYPELVLDIACGSGTYIRALGRDLAKSLGTGAVMCELERTAIGAFHLDQATTPDELTEENLAERLLGPELAVADLPRLDLTAAEAEELRHGRAIAPGAPAPAGELALFDAEGKLLALGKEISGGRLRPTRVFDPANRDT